MPESTLETPDYIFGFKPKKTWGQKEPESVTVTGKSSGQSKQFFGTQLQVKKYTTAVKTFQLGSSYKPRISDKSKTQSDNERRYKEMTTPIIAKYPRKLLVYQQDIEDAYKRKDIALFKENLDYRLASVAEAKRPKVGRITDIYGMEAKIHGRQASIMRGYIKRIKSESKQTPRTQPVPSFLSLSPQKPVVATKQPQKVVKKVVQKTRPVSDPFGFNKILGTPAPKPKPIIKRTKKPSKPKHKRSGKCIVKVRDYYRFI